MRTLFPSIFAVILLASCSPRPRQSDRSEISERYGFRHIGPCHSWLASFETGFKYCASPAFKAQPIIAAAPPEADGAVTKEALMERGGRVYEKICVACHQEDGKGKAGLYPPLAGAGTFYGDAKKQANIIANGLTGPINVLGNPFDGAMPAQTGLSDYEIAAVATYVRNSWGNADGIVTPDDVKAVRK